MVNSLSHKAIQSKYHIVLCHIVLLFLNDISMAIANFVYKIMCYGKGKREEYLCMVHV